MLLKPPRIGNKEHQFRLNHWIRKSGALGIQTFLGELYTDGSKSNNCLIEVHPSNDEFYE